MKLNIELVVDDVSRTVAFYRRVGLDIPEQDVWHDEGTAHHVTVRRPEGADIDIGSVALTQRYDPRCTGPLVGLFFSVESREAVDKRYADLMEAGYREYLAPFDAFWGCRYAIVEDPDGNRVGVMSPQDRDHA